MQILGLQETVGKLELKTACITEFKACMNRTLRLNFQVLAAGQLHPVGPKLLR